ncbi:hypothetical protein CHS0354_012093 [Potamilus streckersoni]|uniref:Uncharacterized protein n=1 Tax=Potamilus streckersoni TaxID=2493646 RepID=A0AAE0VSZ6_9BIVA|nr:hypothetical protein CHS0354_012093 [Potamilus streckersoni]
MELGYIDVCYVRDCKTYSIDKRKYYWSAFERENNTTLAGAAKEEKYIYKWLGNCYMFSIIIGKGGGRIKLMDDDGQSPQRACSII